MSKFIAIEIKPEMVCDRCHSVSCVCGVYFCGVLGFPLRTIQTGENEVSAFRAERCIDKDLKEMVQ